MRHRRHLAGLVLFSVLSASSQVFAQEALIDEFRFGGTWAQPSFIDIDHPEGDQAGLNAEILFAPFNFDHRGNAADGLVHSLLTPRFHIGGMVNLDDKGTSYGYAGLTWQFNMTERLFVETSFGASVNNGKKNGELDQNSQLSRARLGSSVLFRESIALGYRFSETMTGIVQLDHNSHAGFADDKNRGLTGMHFKVGYSF